MRMNCKCLAFPFKTDGNKGLSAEISSQNKVQSLMHSALLFLLNAYFQVSYSFSVVVDCVTNSFANTVPLFARFNYNPASLDKSPFGWWHNPEYRPGQHLANQAPSHFGPRSAFRKKCRTSPWNKL